MLAIMQMYVEGVSTRKVRDITEALCGLEISKPGIGAGAKLDGEVEQWRERPVEKVYPHLMIDARYEKVRRGGEVISQGVLLAVGVSEDGTGKCWACGSPIRRAKPARVRCSTR